MTLTLNQARRALVALHFGDADIAQLSPTDQVVAHAKKRGCIQFDPLNVVGRNPDLMLQSRIEDYRPEHLSRALYDEWRLVDGFDKNLSIYPVEDYPYFARMRAGISAGYRENPVITGQYDWTLDEIARRGALCSDDLGLNEKVRWPWGETTLSRALLESLWMMGRLIIHHKKGTRRYFDLIENYLPADVLGAPDPNPSDEQYHRWQVRRRIRSVGMLWNRGSDAFLCIGDMKKPRRDAAFEALERSGAIEPVEVEGIAGPLYVAAEDMDCVIAAAQGEPEPVVRVIAPLDNLMWDRRLIEALFGFRYRWEVYVPAAQREYGYYVLPVLLGDRFVARFEPENYRGGVLNIKTWWWEQGFEPDAEARAAVDACMHRFERYLKA